MPINNKRENEFKIELTSLPNLSFLFNDDTSIKIPNNVFNKTPIETKLVKAKVDFSDNDPDKAKALKENKNMANDFDVKKNNEAYISPSLMNQLVKIIDVTILVPNKVIQVMFSDGTITKAVCKEPDVFSLEWGIAICIGKKLMGGSSAYNNAIRKGVKVYNDKVKANKKLDEYIDTLEKQRIKREEYKKRRIKKKQEAEKELQIEIQKEAYIRALEAIKKKEEESKADTAESDKVNENKKQTNSESRTNRSSNEINIE